MQHVSKVLTGVQTVATNAPASTSPRHVTSFMAVRSAHLDGQVGVVMRTSMNVLTHLEYVVLMPDVKTQEASSCVNVIPDMSRSLELAKVNELAKFTD